MTRHRKHNAFQRAVREALAQIPEAFQPYLEQVVVVVEAAPDPEVMQALDIDPDEGLYGLFEGPSLLERDAHGLDLPGRIVLYQEALELDFPDPATLRTEILRTVIHEVAHHFGIEEDRLEALGWD